MSFKIAPLHTEHCSVDVLADPVPDMVSIEDELYSAVSEKHGETNTGYLVARTGDGDRDWWCGCDGFRYHCLEGDDVVDTCKHVDAVRKRTRRAVEDDQATLLGGATDE
jgi:hypothetical protein